MTNLFNFLMKSRKQADAPNIDNCLLETVKELSRNDILNIFDVGACYGRYSLASSKIFSNAKIHCFEPYPEAFKILKKTLVGERFHLNNLAISDEIGDAKFYVNELHETNSLLKAAHTNSIIDKFTKAKSEIIVSVTTLQNYCYNQDINGIDLLKIDVQGNTFNVIKGTFDLLAQGKIKYIQCEVEFLEIYKNQKLFHHIASYLEEYNYHLFSLYNLHFDVNGRLSWADALFTYSN